MIPTITITPTVHQPILGLGTWKLLESQCEITVKTALEIGYRHIDTANIYGNQKEIARGIAASKVPRNEIFITSKVWRTELDSPGVVRSAHQALSELKTDYLDQFLIHWPNTNFPIDETLESLITLQQTGLIKSYGVCNFTITHIQEMLDNGHKPQVNQVELHPSLQQPDLIKFCRQHEIQPVAYSPLGQGQDLHIATIQEIAAKYDKEPSQIILRFFTQQNIIVIPKASSLEHLQSNLDSLNFSLSPDEMERISQTDTANRILHPSFAEFDQ